MQEVRVWLGRAEKTQSDAMPRVKLTGSKKRGEMEALPRSVLVLLVPKPFAY